MARQAAAASRHCCRAAGDVARSAERVRQRQPELHRANVVERARAGTDGERDLVESGRLLPAELPRRMLGAAARMGEGLREAGAGARAREVSHQLGGDGVRMRARGALDGVGDPLMPGRAARRLDLVEDDAPDQGMREGVAASVGDEDAIAHARSRTSATVAPSAADDSHTISRRPTSKQSPSRAPTASTVRQPAPKRSSRRETTSRTPGGSECEILAGREAALAREQAHELTEEERIAVGLAMEMEAEGVAVGAGARAGDVPDTIGRRESVEHQAARRRLAGEARERREERVAARHLGVAIGGDQQQPVVRQIGRHELEQLERRAHPPIGRRRTRRRAPSAARARRRNACWCRRGESALGPTPRRTRRGSIGIRSRSTAKTRASSAAKGPAVRIAASSPTSSTQRRNAAFHGQNGGAAPSSQQRATRPTRPHAAASRGGDRREARLPDPGSPPISTTLPFPARAASQADRSTPSSWTRPTNGSGRSSNPGVAAPGSTARTIQTRRLCRYFRRRDPLPRK